MKNRCSGEFNGSTKPTVCSDRSSIEGEVAIERKEPRRLAPDTRLVKRERAIADHARAFRGRVARISKIEQPHFELALARDVHEPVYTDTAASLLTAELGRAVENRLGR